MPLSLVAAIARAANSAELMNRIVDAALVLIPNADGSSLEMRRNASELEYVAAAGALAQHVGLVLPIAESLSGLSLTTGELVSCPDVSDDPRVLSALRGGTSLRSMLCLPLSSQPGGVAVLKVSSQRPHAFTQDDADRLAEIVPFLSTTLQATAELARLTTDLLERSYQSTAATPLWESGEVPDQRMAQFVASVVQPDLVALREVSTGIERVITQRRIQIVAQPIIDLYDGRVRGVEMLSRFPDWPHLSPASVFEQAEAFGLGPDLELLAIEEAVFASAEVPLRCRFGINAGPAALHSPLLLNAVDGADLARMTLELTEHTRMPTSLTLDSPLGVLRRAGVQLAIDDTGKGFSSLSRILDLRPEVIKLDRELTLGIETDPVRQALASALVGFASGLQALVVAEGIETRSAFDLMRSMGVQCGQGFLLGRPVPVSKVNWGNPSPVPLLQVVPGHPLGALVPRR
ncbi:MAG: sensor domain-containing phosphodiesterase [Candidatus Nanopelagicales bacterium]